MESDGFRLSRKRRFHTLTSSRRKRIRELYFQEPRLTLQQIAATMREGVSLTTLRKWCDLMGLPRRGLGRLTPEVEDQLRKIVAERPLARDQEILAALGNIVSIHTLRGWCRQHNISRPHSDSILTEELAVRLRALAQRRPCPTFEQLREVIGGNPQPRTVKKICAKLGIPWRRTPRRRRGSIENLKLTIREVYPKEKPPTLRELVLATGSVVSRGTMRKLCRELGLMYRREAKKPSGGPTPAEESRLREFLASDPRPSRSKMAQALGISRGTLSRWIAKRFGVPIKRHGPALNPEIERWLRFLLASNPNFSRKKLASKFGVHPATIWTWMRRLGIGTKTSSTPPE